MPPLPGAFFIGERISITQYIPMNSKLLREIILQIPPQPDFKIISG